MDRSLQQRLEEDPVLEQAAEWFAELQGTDMSLERVAEWQRWLLGDERHRAAYAGIESMWGAVAPVPAAVWPALRDIEADKYDPADTVSAWHAGRRPRHTFRYALAASILLAVTAGAWQFSTLHNWLSPSSTTIETRIGESRTVRLSDGSRITVGGSSAVSANLTGELREIRLEGGEAFFEVAKDSRRPFVVRAGDATVTAIGTQFNVRRGAGEVSDMTIVGVAQGVVQVDGGTSEGLRLVTGEQLSLAGDGSVHSRQIIDPGAVGGWRTGRLQYLDEPLSAVVADVRRYVARDISIADPAVGALRITGTVFSNDLDSWLRTLEAAFPVRIRMEDPGQITLLPAEDLP